MSVELACGTTVVLFAVVLLKIVSGSVSVLLGSGAQVIESSFMTRKSFFNLNAFFGNFSISNLKKCYTEIAVSS
jgi:hypothetical protein